MRDAIVAAKKPSHSEFQLLPDELSAQVKALAEIGDQTSGLVASARRLAEHQPLLGGAPPALHLASRLQDAAGQSGLTGEVSAADTELANYHQALGETVRRYQNSDTAIASHLNEEGKRR